MKLEFVDFKTVKLNSMLDTGMSSELSLTQSGKVSAKLPDDVKEFSDEAMNAGLELAQAKTFEAIRTISVGMGINELDLGAQE